MDLSDRRIIAFASHALVPGDLDGLDQPAIALTSPTITGDTTSDGLLTMGKVMGLRLDNGFIVAKDNRSNKQFCPKTGVRFPGMCLSQDHCQSSFLFRTATIK